ATSAWKLGRLLGEPGVTDDEEGTNLSQVEQAIQSVRQLLADFEPRLAEVRARTEAVENKANWWLANGPIIISVACAWIALSQISLLVAAWSGWRRAAGRVDT